MLRAVCTLAAVAAVVTAVPSIAGAAPKTFGGVVPDIPTGGHVKPSSPRAHFANLPYGGGPVMHSNRTHVIFWQPQGSGLSYDPGYQQQVDTFLRRVARDSHKTTNVYSLSGQYRDAQGQAAYASTYGGAVLDTHPLPPNGCTEPLPPPLGTGPPAPTLGVGLGWSVCLTDEQLIAELWAITRADHLPVSPNDLYFLVLPNGFGVCEPNGCALGGANDSGSFCGYHSNDPDGVLLYAVIPYNAVDGHCQSGEPRPNANTADPAISTISHEHNEAVTDPTGTAWIDTSFNENGDLCIDMTEHPPPTLGGSGDSSWSEVIAGGHYWLQQEWSNADHSCQAAARPDLASFRVPSRIRAGRSITLTARAQTGRARVKAYDWSFGGRSHGHGRTVKHRFASPGSYRLRLRVTDTWGNWVYVDHTVRVTKRRHANRR